MITKLDYNQNWCGQFKLDETSPSGLVRIKSKFGNNIENTPVGIKNFRKDGTPCGWRLKFNRVSYYIHRIIWILNYGNLDSTLVIDHLDGNPFNNSICNIFLKTPENNMKNKKKHRNNKTGITGVYLMEDKRGYSYYAATWNELDGSRNTKLFSFLKLGKDTAKILAVAYREEQIARLILEGADYTNRHGL